MPTARTRIAATLLAATLTTTACQDAGAPAPGPTIDEAIMCNLAFTHAERLAKQIQALADQQDAFAAVVAFQAEQARTFPDYEARKAQLTPEFARLRELRRPARFAAKLHQVRNPPPRFQRLRGPLERPQELAVP